LETNANYNFPPIECIHFDLDGVLAACVEMYHWHFNGVELTHEEASNAEFISHPEFWGNVEAFERNGGNWFYDLPLRVDAQEMVDEVRGLGIPMRILTATGRNYNHVTAQKVAWCERHFGIHPADITTVIKSEDKGEYAKPGHVLIDDSQRSIGAWLSGGGIGILHKTAASTMPTLRKLVKFVGLARR
jgi:hypothetical protein